MRLAAIALLAVATLVIGSHFSCATDEGPHDQDEDPDTTDLYLENLASYPVHVAVAGLNTGIAAFAGDLASGEAGTILLDRSVYKETGFTVHLASDLVIDSFLLYYDDGECGAVMVRIFGSAPDTSDLSHDCLGSESCQEGFVCEGGNDQTPANDDDDDGDDDGGDDTGPAENHDPEIEFSGIYSIYDDNLIDTPYVLGQNCIFWDFTYRVLDEDDNLTGGAFYENIDGSGWVVADPWDFYVSSGQEYRHRTDITDYALGSHNIAFMVRDGLDAPSNVVSVDFEVVETSDCVSR